MLLNKFKTSLLCLFFSTLIFCRHSVAQDLDSTNYKIDDFSLKSTFHGHVGAALGSVFSQDISYSGHGVVNSFPLSAEGKISFRPAVAEAIITDYQFAKHVALEFELAHSKIFADAFDGTLGIGGFPINGKTSISGHIEGVSGLFNLAFNPLDRQNSFTPVFGGGLGFSSSWARLDSISAFGHAVPIGLSSSQTNLSADFFASLEKKFFPSFFLAWHINSFGPNREISAAIRISRPKMAL